MLGFVICGIEHSGTTLVSDLFRQVPEIDAGFEVGVLLGRSPRDFPNSLPFAHNILEGWGLTNDALSRCCDTDDFAEFYDRLQREAAVLKPDAKVIFDKTPRYFAQLSHCLERTPSPFIAMYKDPRAIVYSDFSRSGERDFDKWFANYIKPKRRYMEVIYSQFEKFNENRDPRICFISLEELCLEARKSCEKIFAHVGYDFDLKYLLLRNLRYAHTREPSISSRIPFEYLEHFSAATQMEIEKHFGMFSEWFYR